MSDKSDKKADAKLDEYSFLCAICGDSCISDRTHTEAMEEYKKMYPMEHAAGLPFTAICDDCFNLMETKH